MSLLTHPKYIRTILYTLLLITLSSAKPAYAVQKHFDAIVKAGETWEKDIGDGLILQIQSANHNGGWVVDIVDNDKKGIPDSESYMYPVNPPYRFGTPMDIWPLGNTQCGGEPFDCSFEKDLKFLLNKKDMELANRAMQKILWSYSDIPEFPTEEYALDVIGKMKTGKLKMTAIDKVFVNEKGEVQKLNAKEIVNGENANQFLKMIHYKITVTY